MRTIVAALIHSLAGIFNVAVVVMIVWMMFAILAVNLFGGKLNYCTVDTYVNHTEEECKRHHGEWLI
jgi:Ion transport protein